MSRRVLIGLAATAAVLLPLGYFWQQSLLPDTYSVMTMGYPDYGGGPPMAAMKGMTDASVTSFDTDALLPATVKITLRAEQHGDHYTFNGTSPGPTIRAHVGDVVEATLVNSNVADGVTIHWHGVDLPNAEDGVAGVTQDAVAPGKSFTYRFVAKDPGTYWYHSHQVSDAQVAGGLYGALIIERSAGASLNDVVAVSHTAPSGPVLNGNASDVHVAAAAGESRRVRIINTDNGSMQVWSDAAYRVSAIDGRELNNPGAVSGQFLSIPAGGRADLTVTSPARVQLGGNAVIVAPTGVPDSAAPTQPAAALDLMSYGAPAAVPLDVSHPDRRFNYSIGRELGFFDGKPGLWWTINGHRFPDVPMFVVRKGDLVEFTIANHSGDTHPMHLHGHHALVVSRDGKESTGSPVWVDSLEVRNGESYVIAFRADNPGIWMDHCHNLPHASQGLVAHLMYEGVTTPFRIGGNAANNPE